MTDKDFEELILIKSAMMVVSEYLDVLKQNQPKLYSKSLKYRGDNFQEELDLHINRFYSVVPKEAEVSVNALQDVFDSIIKGMGKRVLDDLKIVRNG